MNAVLLHSVFNETRSTRTQRGHWQPCASNVKERTALSWIIFKHNTSVTSCPLGQICDCQHTWCNDLGCILVDVAGSHVLITVSSARHRLAGSNCWYQGNRHADQTQHAADSSSAEGFDSSPEDRSRDVFSWPSPVVYFATILEGARPQTVCCPFVALNTCIAL